MSQLLEHLTGVADNVPLLRHHHDGLHDGQYWDQQGGVAGLATSHHRPVEQRRHSDKKICVFLTTFWSRNAMVLVGLYVDNRVLQ